MVRKTKKTLKRAKKSSALTIPELRKSLDGIATYSERLVRETTKSTKEMASEFAAEWKKVFGKSLALKTAEDYLEHMKRMMTGSKRATTRRKMRGGTMLTGAPLDHLTRPGVDIPYGNFLPYVSKGFWNPEQAPAADCNTFKTVLPYAGTGSNKMNGGGIIDSVSQAAGAFGMRLFSAQNPPSVQQDAQTAWKGQPLGPGPDPSQQAWKPQMTGAPTSVPIVQTYTRDLSQDVLTGK